MKPVLVAALSLPLAATAYLLLSGGLTAGAMVRLATGGAPEGFAEAAFLYGTAPRAAMALLAGASLGLAGSLLQQATRNRLVSPLTLGAASGAWLALTSAAALVPVAAAAGGFWFAMAGAVAAVGLVLAIAGPRGIAGLPVVLAGMAANILFGALATLIVLLNEQRTRGLFVWGAGDLTQTDWDWVLWLGPQLTAGLLAAVLVQRPLDLMRLGGEAASARGLAAGPLLAAVWGLALWMTAATVTAVGIIAFIGLLAPNLARLAGVRRAGQELAASLLIGALLLLGTDGLALLASSWTRDMVPSGAAAALIGLPALIWLACKRPQAQDLAAFRLPEGVPRLAGRTRVLLLVALPVVLLLALAVGRDAGGWSAAWPSGLVFELRWPRTLAALAAGAGVAVSGAILQRLLRNPLASPDIVGISAGATLALVGAVLLFDIGVHQAGAPAALLGGLVTLALLLVLARRRYNAPNAVALIGISLAALMDALLQFALAKGGAETYLLVGWLAGSTFRVTAPQAVWLFIAVLALGGTALLLHRWLTLLGIGDETAASRGLAVGPTRVGLLVLAAATAATVTSVVGPIAFVGLIAPHAAALLGAKRAAEQVLVGALLGGLLLVLADWLGRTLLFPQQLPAGATAAVIGGGYFLLLLGSRSLNPFSGRRGFLRAPARLG